MIRKGILILLATLLLLSAGAFSAADEVVFGDADGDGTLTAEDASSISRHINRFHMMDAAAASRADYDGDGKITSMDSSLILSSFMSAEFSVPVTKSFSMLLTSDLCGNAWDPMASDNYSACTAMNTAACLQALREDDPDLLLFDAGGSVFGSSIADDYPKKEDRRCGPITSLFIKLHYDAVLLGDEAFTYPSQTVRKEVNELDRRGIPVIGANLLMSNPTVFDPEGALWNGILPYKSFEIPQKGDREPMRVTVIGMTEPDLAPSDDEILPADPLKICSDLRKIVRKNSDYTVLLYHGNVEVDAESEDSYSLRDLIKKTDFIDLVVVSHGSGRGVRSERNADGVEIPIVSLAGGANTVTKISASLREHGAPAVSVQEIDASAYEPDDSIRRIVRPYVSQLSGIMDAVVCTVAERTERFDPKALSATDTMEIIHEMQLFATQKWLEYQDVDLPGDMVSIAYPYISIGELKEGPLTYRDICLLETETPTYTLLMIRGSELRAWLTAYTHVLMHEETVYSLYGLSYFLNTMNEETPIGFLEHVSGRAAEDDELFTLILAEKTPGELNIRDYIDESWIPYKDRLIEGFTLPVPNKMKTLGEDPVTDALAAYLESVGTLRLKHLYNWIII